MRVRHTAPLVAVAIVGALSACASDGDEGLTSVSSLAVETTATTAPPQADTVAPPATTEPEADEPSVTTAAAEAPATATSGAPPSPPEAGEPNTVNIVFEDGETGVASVTCDSDPADDYDFIEFSVEPDEGELPRFELLFFVTGEKVSEWRTEAETWLVSPTEGSIDVVGDLSEDPISGTGVFLKADVDEEGEIQFTTPSGGQPLTTGEERAAAFTIVCAQ